MDLGKLGSRIKLMREKRRLRQSDVAAALRLSAQAISKWERGENAPDIAVLVQLAQLLGVSVEWILAGTETEPGTFPATVFATSLSGYAERAATSTPAAIAAWANVIHYAVTEAVLRHDGVPVKCVGDGLLGFFSGANQCARAFAAAQDAKTACSQGELVIVLHTGPIYLGSVGHPEYARTDIIGATVNTAFLLAPFVAERCSTRIGMTRAVVDALPNQAGIEACGEAGVLGLAAPAQVFELRRGASE
jgi:class 3 adenylate cyclase